MIKGRAVIRTALILFLLALCVAVEGYARDSKRGKDIRRNALEKSLHAYIDAMTEGFLPRVRQTLARIPVPSRRLLAMKYYMRRSDEDIIQKWAWTSEEARKFRSSQEYRIATDAIEGVKKIFAELNPGYRLQVKMEIRSLESQLGKWNSVRSIQLASAEIVDSCLAYLADSTLGLDTVPTDTSLARLRTLLLAFEPKQVPTVAVPGLSQHGQLRAFDFRIMRGNRLVAGASSRSIATAWDGAGWTAKLREAICCNSDTFEGPLDDPYEPWHYTYIK
jgi:hypothetical protein